MTVIISSLNKETVFKEKDFIIIGSNSDCDYQINAGFEFILTVQYDENSKKQKEGTFEVFFSTTGGAIT